MIRQAFVLVGGRGTRLGTLAAATPKPLLEVAPGRAFLDHVVLELARHGVREITFLAGHLGEQVEARYDGRAFWGADARVLREPEPLGTAGALAFARDAGLLDEHFLMLNGDSLFEINLTALVADALGDDLGRIALRAVPDAGRFGSVEHGGGRITAFREKDPASTGPGVVNGGIYLLRREVAQRITTLPASIETDVFPALVAQGRLGGMAFDGYFLDIGLPDTLAQARQELPERWARPIAFLDRDGTINRDEQGYTHRIEDLDFVEGAPEAIRMLNEAGHLVVVVTNQAGIARGRFTEDDFHRFMQAMRARLAAHGAHIDAVYHAPWHADAVVEAWRHPDHPDRKPNAGMIERAFAEWPSRRAGSFLIGDSESDLEAARRAGLPGHAIAPGGCLKAVVAHALATSGRTALNTTETA
jgi:D-glycero-D-manno-heptose 1,7-bisphosphate phosphatase